MRGTVLEMVREATSNVQVPKEMSDLEIQRKPVLRECRLQVGDSRSTSNSWAKL